MKKKLAEKIKVGQQVIAENQPTFIIAEIGSVHDGSFGLAKCLIKAAAGAGANAVKFQIHIPEAETILNAPAPSYFKEESRFEYFKRTEFSLKQWADLKKYAEFLGLVFFASSFSMEATELLEKIETPLHKVPSGEISNIPYLEHMAKTRKPILLSSGMSNWTELDAAVSTVAQFNSNVAVLQCTTEYPVRESNIGLNVIPEMADRYHALVGFSDHSVNNYSAFAAVSLGAKIIEKHFTLSKEMYGSDAKHSLTPCEFTDLVRGIRFLERVISSPVNKDDSAPFKEMRLVFQKSIVAAGDIPKGTVLSLFHLSFKKPGDGLPPSEYKNIIGRKTKIGLKKDQKVLFRHLI